MSALELYSLKTELLHAIAEAADLAKLEEVRIAALGRKGRIPELMQALGSLPPEERKAYGQVVNSLKASVGEALEASRAELSKADTVEKLAQERADVTLPVRLGPLAEGRIHPVSQVTDEITEIFADMGFSIAEGPDIETDFNNFTALNIPPEHPARQDHDTFYFPEAPDGSRAVLRTHTSPVQIRTMLREKPPLRIIAPGRVYRCDSDQTHTPMFHQVEGLVIDEETHLGHLKWVLEEFCKAFFEVPQVKMRFRASHFPFTEPSMEVDIGYAKVGDEIRIGEGEPVAGDSRLRHGASERAEECRARSRALSGLRLRPRHRPHRHAEIRHAGSARVLRRRSALAQALRLPAARHPHPCRGTLLSHEVHSLMAEGASRHQGERGRDRRDADPRRPRGRGAVRSQVRAQTLPRGGSGDMREAPRTPTSCKSARSIPARERLQVVCGAPNARAGMKGVFAPVGSYVPGIDLTLTKAKIRGVEFERHAAVGAGTRTVRRA